MTETYLLGRPPNKFMKILGRIDTAEVIGYIGSAMILVWALLKATGIIQSPIWVEMIPFVGAGLGVITLIFRAGRMVEKIERVIFDLEKLTARTSSIDYRLTSLESDFTGHNH